MKKQYRCPDGTLTTSSKKYFKAWRKLARPIEKATNSKCYAFDPGMLFTTKDKPFEYSWGLGLYEARLLAKALTK